MKAMQYLGVGPLEFEELPAYYRERALVAINAENWAENEAMQRAKKS